MWFLGFLGVRVANRAPFPVEFRLPGWWDLELTTGTPEPAPTSPVRFDSLPHSGYNTNVGRRAIPTDREQWHAVHSGDPDVNRLPDHASVRHADRTWLPIRSDGFQNPPQTQVTVGGFVFVGFDSLGKVVLPYG